MKNLGVFLVLSIIFWGFPVFAVSNQSNQDQSRNNYSSTETQSRTQTESQTRTNNPETGEMEETKERTRTEESDQDADEDFFAESSYEPKQESSKQRNANISSCLTKISSAIEDLKEDDQTIGLQIQDEAKAFSEEMNNLNVSYDKVLSRSRFAKVFIGPNYKEMNNIKQIRERNQQRIQNMENAMVQLNNAEDQYKISLEINNLLKEQISLQNELNNMSKGFSLFGWVSRFWNKYSL